MDFCSTGIQFI